MSTSAFSPPTAPDIAEQPIRSDAEALLEIVVQLGSALIHTAQETDDPAIIHHVRTAHRVAPDLYGTSEGSWSFRKAQENAS